MAENKKSFILYADLLNVVNKLPKEKAGELFVHILKYVNDMNPETDDLVINIAFEPIKLQLKRDLKKWESNIEQRRQAGLRSAESRRAKINDREHPSTTVERESTNSTVTVNVNDIINKTKNKEFNYYIINENTQWKNSVYRDKITAKKIPMSYEKFENLLIEFCNTQKNNMRIPKSEPDYRTHFQNWLDIQSKKENNHDKGKPKLSVT